MVAYELGQIGDHAGTLAAYQALLPDAERALGLKNPLTAFIQTAIDEYRTRGKA
jgi:hypothetical protein